MTPLFPRTKRKGIPDLHDKVVVITGAASGIGRALAVALQREGCRLALADIDADGLAALRQELAVAAPSNTVSTHVTDVANRDQMRELAHEVITTHGAVHVLINNAGVTHEGTFPQTSLDDWQRIIGVNLWGVIHGCHFFLPHLARVDRAHIVNVSSVLGIASIGGQSAYGTTKYAIRGLSEALWEELRPTSIGLTVAHPGAVATNILKRASGNDSELLQRLDSWNEKNAIRPELVSARIIRAIKRGTPRVLIGPDAAIGDFLKRIMPVQGNRVVGDMAMRTFGEHEVLSNRVAHWQKEMRDQASTESPPASLPRA